VILQLRRIARTANRPVRIRQCLINLINAINLPKGHIYVNVSQTAAGQDLHQFDIEDTGVSIPLDKQVGHRWHPGRQYHPETTAWGGPYQKLGNAQATAVINQPGVGSVFTMTIDAEPSGANAGINERRKKRAPTQIDSRQNHRIQKILMAEDNPVNQQLMQVLLKKMGYEATLVDNGKLAVEAMEKGSFDIILMDIQMPEMKDRSNPDHPTKRIQNTYRGDYRQCPQGDREQYGRMRRLLPKPVDKYDSRDDSQIYPAGIGVRET
jgi:CheY-like chemotaxis protein